jgi:hypothetical protein
MHRKLLLGAALSALCLFAADPFAGTWKLNKEKSSNLPPDMATTREYVRIIQARGADNHDVIMKRTDADGKVTQYEFVSHSDGKEYPAVRRTGKADPDVKYARQLVDERHAKTVYKRDGKQLQVADDVVSADGRVWTETRTGSNRAGEPIHQVFVWDKQ